MKLTIIGASGHGKVIASIANLCGYNEIEFLDDNPYIESCAGFPVVGKSELASGIDNDIFVGIGNAEVRENLMRKFSDKHMPTLIHPGAVIAQGTRIGKGTVVMPGAVVNPGAVIGDGVIVNTASSVDHDCVVHDFVHISVGSHLCGMDEIGEKCWIGAGVTVINQIRICPGCVIGAGAVVVRDINEKGTYVGVPARKVHD